MSVYRFTIPVEFVVEIDEGNARVDGPPALQGDTPTAAVNRARWVLMREDIAQLSEALFDRVCHAKRPLGVTRIIVRGKAGQVPVTEDGAAR